MKATFANIVAAAAASSGLTQKDIRLAVQHVFRHLYEAADQSGSAKIPRALSVRVVTRKSRKVVNPATGESMKLPRQRLLHARVAQPWRRLG